MVNLFNSGPNANETQPSHENAQMASLQTSPGLGQSVQGIFTITGPVQSGSPLSGIPMMLGEHGGSNDALQLNSRLGQSNWASPSSKVGSPYNTQSGSNQSKSSRQSFKGSLGSSKEKRTLRSHLNVNGPASPIRTSEESLEFSSIRTDTRQKNSHSPSNQFGGASFGTPKLSAKRNDSDSTKNLRSIVNTKLDDAPPVLSIYDSSLSDVFGSSQNLFSKNESSSSESKQMQIQTIPQTSTLAPNKAFKENPKSVIVFGYPNNYCSLVLDTFQRLGSATVYSLKNSREKTDSPKYASIHGNWVRLQYSDAAGAARAVAMNGSLIAGKFIVGCIYASRAISDLEKDNDSFAEDVMDIDNFPTRHKLPLQFENESINIGIAPKNNRQITTIDSQNVFSDQKPNNTFRLPDWLNFDKNESMHQQTSDNKERTECSTWYGRLFRVFVETLFGI